MPMKRFAVGGILALAFLGLADSLYLAESAETGTPLICDVQNLTGCNIVAASQYSRVFGIPLAEYGVFFYGVLFVLAAIELALYNRFLRRTLQAVAVLGVLFSLYFSALQLFVINAFCIYCIASAIIALLVLICASAIEPIRVRKEAPPSVQPHPYLRMPPEA